MDLALDSPLPNPMYNQKELLIITFKGRKTEKVVLMVCKA